MMKTFTLVFVLCASTALSALTTAPAMADVEADIAAYMEFVRTHKYDVPESTADMKAQPGAVVAALWKYIGDPSENVRVSYFGMASFIAHRNKEANLGVKREAVELMLSGIEVEPFPALIRNVAEGMASLPRSLFSPRAKEIIALLMSRDVALPEVVRLAGRANVNTARVRRKLETLARTEATAPNARAGARSHGAAHWALASMGDDLAIQAVIADVEAEQDIIIKASRLQDLAHLRQPQAVAVLVRYLFSEDRLPSPVDHAMLGRHIAQDARAQLAKIIEGFPGPEGLSYSDEDLARARHWVRQRGLGNLRIRD